LDRNYKQQRARTRAADEAHAKMLEWYAKQLDVSASDIRTELVKQSPEKLKALWKRYNEQTTI
jgi:hypothetical protein